MENTKNKYFCCYTLVHNFFCWLLFWAIFRSTFLNWLGGCWLDRKISTLFVDKSGYLLVCFEIDTWRTIFFHSFTLTLTHVWNGHTEMYPFSLLFLDQHPFWALWVFNPSGLWGIQPGTWCPLTLMRRPRTNRENPRINGGARLWKREAIAK
jgi:hypothetical protein